MVKEKKETNMYSKIVKKLSSKVSGKKILKTEKATLTIKQRDVPSVLGDTNRFFKEEMEETKRSMFLK